MSHMIEIATVIKNLDAFKAACQELGFDFIEGQKTYEWYGKWVGDSPMPQGMTTADLGHCDHAVRIPGCKYEVGLCRGSDGYRLVYDYWERSLNEVLGQTAMPLVDCYAKHQTYHEVARRGDRVVANEVLEDGTRKLVIQEGGAW